MSIKIRELSNDGGKQTKKSFISGLIGNRNKSTREIQMSKENN